MSKKSGILNKMVKPLKRREAAERQGSSVKNICKFYF